MTAYLKNCIYYVLFCSLRKPKNAMQPSVPRGNKKKAAQPVIVTTNTVCGKFSKLSLIEFLINNRHSNLKYPNGQLKREKQRKKND